MMLTRRAFLRHTSVLASAVSAWPLLACSPKAPNMTPEEAQFMERLTQRLTTRSVGRYLVDVPEEFVLNPIHSTVVDHVTIQVRPMPRAAFELALHKRESELRAKHMDGKPNRSVLKRLEPVPEGHFAKIFNRAEHPGSAEFGRLLELMAWQDEYGIQMEIAATDGTDLDFDASAVGTPFESSERRIFDQYKVLNDTPEKLSHLLKVYSRVRGRREDEIPTDQGDCIANGFVAGPPSDQQAIDVAYHLQGSPDVYFNFNHTTTVRERDTLLERTAKTEQEMQGSGTQTVRKGKRDLNGLPYEEWLMRGPTPDRVPGTLSILHGNETASDPAKPFVELRLFNGFRIPAPERTLEEKAQLKDLEKATLTEAQAVALWDKVTATLRVRPGAI